jgi:hypothetical protein
MAQQCYWPTEMIAALRVIINDFDATSYTDSRLTQILVAAAMTVRQEVRSSTTYTISMGTRTISPDPADPDDKDYNFLSLVVLKAACMLDINDLRLKAAKEGVRATCGPITAEVRSGSNNGYKLVVESGPCEMYASLKEKINFRDPMEAGTGFRAILSPFVSNTFAPKGNEYNSEDRGV